MADPSRMELVVVAIPQLEDRVWKVSSEPVPHMTLLYLGEINWTPEEFRSAAEFVGHATSMLTRFGMNVNRRGTLGDKNADVVFFDKAHNYQKLLDFRSNLLTNRVLKNAYLSASQHPSWIPHLTLGYPETPAKPDDGDYPINWVEFDRIALWTGESKGPEFRLQSYGGADLEVAMSTIQAGADFLAHYGVKGMKWGQHKKSRQTEPNSSDANAAGAIKSRVKTQKTTRILTNKELKDTIERMRLEQEFSKLSGGLDKTHTQKAKAFVSKLLGDAGKQGSQQIANNEAKNLFENAIKNARR